jgi:hypothetical protein
MKKNIEAHRTLKHTIIDDTMVYSQLFLITQVHFGRLDNFLSLKTDNFW